MTVRLASYRVSRIFGDYLKGLPQPKIAQKNGVNQSSVSHYASRLRERVDDSGLLAAGREFGIMHEIDSLRSLAVELYKNKLTVEEAKDGLRIIKAFHKLGIPSHRHSALVKVCGEVEEPDFVKVAMRLVELEKATGMSYQQVVSQFEKVTSDLNDLDEWKNRLQSELVELEQSVAEQKAELKATEERLARLQKQIQGEQTELESELRAQKRRVEGEKARLDKELDKMMEESKVTRGEIDAVAKLKADLRRRGLDLPTIVSLAEEFKDETEG